MPLPTPPSPQGPVHCPVRGAGLRRRGAALLLGLLLGTGSAPVPAQEDASLKAAIVFNLLMFVQWPGEAGLPAGTPLLLCADRAGALWQHLVSLRDRPLRQYRLELRELADNDQLRDCQILLLEPGGTRRLPPRRPGAPLLTVGSDERADDGEVVLGLRHVSGRVVFDVDLGAARRGGLQISSKLLRLARAVRE